jgi:hypothetical protein
MSDVGKVASLFLQAIFAIFLICIGIRWWIEDFARNEEPFAGFENLEDCIMQNWNKRDPRQYCLKIRRKIEAARRRKRRR